MNGSPKITVSGGTVTPQIVALIIYIPNVVSGSVDFHLLKDRTTSYDGLDGNSSIAKGADFALSKNSNGSPEADEVKGVQFTDASGSPYPFSAVVYVLAKDYGGFTTVGIEPQNVVVKVNGQDTPLNIRPFGYNIPEVSLNQDGTPFDFISVPWRLRFDVLEDATADTDQSTLYQATVLGDHLSVFEEYRGFTIGGSHYTMPLAKSFDGSSTGGPATKDGFFEDDTGKLPTDAANLMPLLGVCWHQIQLNEMDADAAQRKDLAGWIDPNTPTKYLINNSHYRCLRYIDHSSPSGDEASASAFVSDGSAIYLDVSKIEAYVGPGDLNLSADGKKAVYGFFAGHEAGHKVGLQHPPPHRMYVTPSQPMPGPDGFLVETFDNPQVFGYWVIGYDKDTDQTTVGLWVAGANAALDPAAPAMGAIELPVDFPSESLPLDNTVPAKVHRADGDWPATALKVKLKGKISGSSNGNLNPYLDVYTHTGALIDHIVNPFRVQAVLSPSDGAMVNVKR